MKFTLVIFGAMEIAQKIKQLRVANGLNQKELAEMAGVSQAALNKIESGKTQNPGIDVILRIAETLKTDIYTLFPNFENNKASAQMNSNELLELKMKVLSAIVMYESQHVLFKSFELNEDDPKDQQKLEEFKKMISMFKTGLTQTLINVGFFTKEDIEYYRENYK